MIADGIIFSTNLNTVGYNVLTVKILNVHMEMNLLLKVTVKLIMSACKWQHSSIHWNARDSKLWKSTGNVHSIAFVLFLLYLSLYVWESSKRLGQDGLEELFSWLTYEGKKQ